MDKINFVNGQRPPLNAENLNAIQDNTERAIKLVDDKVEALTGFDIRLVDELPSTGEKGIIYLVKRSKPEGDNYRDEYIWIDSESRFELVGSTELSVSGLITDSVIGYNDEEIPEGFEEISGLEVTVSENEPEEKTKVWLQKEKRSKNSLDSSKKSNSFSYSNNVYSNVGTDTRANLFLSIQDWNNSTILNTKFTEQVTNNKIVIGSFTTSNNSNYLSIKHNGSSIDLFIFDKNIGCKPNTTYTFYCEVEGYNPTITNGIKIKNMMLLEGNYTLDNIPPYEPYYYQPNSIKTLNANGEYEDFITNVYSSEEHIVGKWLDGKWLYEKTISLPAVDTLSKNNVTNLSSYNITNVDHIHIDYGNSFVNNSSNESQPVEGLINTSVFNHSWVEKTKIYRYCTNSALNGTWVMTLRYTKTID